LIYTKSEPAQICVLESWVFVLSLFRNQINIFNVNEVTPTFTLSSLKQNSRTHEKRNKNLANVKGLKNLAETFKMLEKNISHWTSLFWCWKKIFFIIIIISSSKAFHRL